MTGDLYTMEKKIYHRILRVKSEKNGFYLLFTTHYSPTILFMVTIEK